MNVEFRNQILKLINLIFIPLIKGRKYAINTVGNVKYQTFNIFLFFIYAYFLEMELCTFAQKVGRYQKKLPTFLCTEKGTYLLGGWGKILKVTFNLQFFLFPLYYHLNIHDFICHIKFTTFNCQAASKGAELYCWLLCPKSKDICYFYSN